MITNDIRKTYGYLSLDIFLSELRIAADEEEILDLESIRPGSKSICHASVQLMLDRRGTTIKTTKAKLDSCGSVPIAHVNLLNCIKPARKYKLPSIRLRGIGGKTKMLKKVGILRIKRPDNECCALLCYVFNEVVGQTEEMLLISLSAIIDAKINILYRMKESNKDTCCDLQFWPNNKSFEEIRDDIGMKEEIHKVIRHKDKLHPRDMYLSSDEFEQEVKDKLFFVTEEIYMTEIQLRRIVDRNAQEGSDQQSDGDERMVKDGQNTSKFSKEAMTLGEDVYAYEGNAPEILHKVYTLYDLYVGEDRVFPVKNGAPSIRTIHTHTSSNPNTQRETRNFPVSRQWIGQAKQPPLK